jgi:multiple sugar transport system permease protein
MTIAGSNDHVERRLNPRKVALSLLLLGVVLCLLVPYLWLILTSFKDRNDIFQTTPSLTFKPTLGNYREAFVEKNFVDNLRNSIIVSTVSTGIALLVGIPAAYAMARFDSRGNRAVLLLLLATRLLPAIVLAVPLFVLFADVGLINTYLAPITAHLTFNIPFTVWMMRGFFLSIPAQIDEAAVVDGCTPLGAFVRTVLPLAKGGIAATAIFAFINSWNELLYGTILTGRDTATLPVAVPSLLTPIGTFWGQIAAVGVVTTLPVLVFSFAAQRQIVKGMTGGALSGV